MAKWLDKYEQGGLVLKQKTKDNYGKKPNPNNVQASVGPDFVGMGSNTKGRNYSPAWGGQFQMGGSMPGAVGFMYARTQDPAPSNGPYAKKTKASAQDGKVLEANADDRALLGFGTSDPAFQYVRANSFVPFDRKDFEGIKQNIAGYMNSPLYMERLSKSIPDQEVAKDVQKQRLDNLLNIKLNPKDVDEGTNYSLLQNRVNLGASDFINNPTIAHEVAHGIIPITNASYGKQNLLSKAASAVGGLFQPFEQFTGSELEKINRPLSGRVTAPNKLYQKAIQEEHYAPQGSKASARTAAGETYGDLTGIRQLLLDNGVTTEFGQELTPEMFQKALKNPKVSNEPTFQRMKLKFSDEDIIKMNNEVAYNNRMTPLNQAKSGVVIKDDMGQWAHPGEITEINSNDITMEGVDYPVLGVSDTGDTKLMQPGENYKFKGKKVTEFPMMKNGGWLDKYKAQNGKKVKGELLKNIGSADDEQWVKAKPNEKGAQFFPESILSGGTDLPEVVVKSTKPGKKLIPYDGPTIGPAEPYVPTSELTGQALLNRLEFEAKVQEYKEQKDKEFNQKYNHDSWDYHLNHFKNSALADPKILAISTAAALLGPEVIPPLIEFTGPALAAPLFNVGGAGVSLGNLLSIYGAYEGGKGYANETYPLTAEAIKNPTSDNITNAANSFGWNTLAALPFVAETAPGAKYVANEIGSAINASKAYGTLSKASKLNPWAKTLAGQPQRQIFGNPAYESFLKYGPTTQPEVSAADQLAQWNKLVEEASPMTITRTGENMQVAGTTRFDNSGMRVGTDYPFAYFSEGSPWYGPNRSASMAKALGQERRIVPKPGSNLDFYPAGESSVVVNPGELSKEAIQTYAGRRRVLAPSGEAFNPEAFDVYEPHWWKGYQQIKPPVKTNFGVVDEAGIMTPPPLTDSQIALIQRQVERQIASPSDLGGIQLINKSPKEQQVIPWSSDFKIASHAPEGNVGFVESVMEHPNGNVIKESFSQNVKLKNKTVGQGYYSIENKENPTQYVTVNTESQTGNPYVSIKDMSFFGNNSGVADAQAKMLLASMPSKATFNPHISTSVYSTPILNTWAARLANSLGRIEILPKGYKSLNHILKSGPGAADDVDQILTQFPKIKKSFNILSEKTGVKLADPEMYFDGKKIDPSYLKSDELKRILMDNPDALIDQFKIQVPSYKLIKHWKNGGWLDKYKAQDGKNVKGKYKKNTDPTGENVERARLLGLTSYDPWELTNADDPKAEFFPEGYDSPKGNLPEVVVNATRHLTPSEKKKRQIDEMSKYLRSNDNVLSSDQMASQFKKKLEVDKQLAERQRLAKRETVRSYDPETEDESAASRMWHIATNPMTALSYKTHGKDIPEHFERGERNILDYAVDVINPAFYANELGLGAKDIGGFTYKLATDPYHANPNQLGSGLLHAASAIPLFSDFAPVVSRALENPITRNLKDLQYAKSVYGPLGYKIPENLERIAQSKMLTDRTIRGLVNRDNSFFRGVTTDWDLVKGRMNLEYGNVEGPKRWDEFVNTLKGKGIDIYTDPKAAAEYMATHVPLSNAGFGRSGLSDDILDAGYDALYTSNSSNLGEGYTYGQGYLVKGKRPTFFDSKNRKDWIDFNQVEATRPKKWAIESSDIKKPVQTFKTDNSDKHLITEYDPYEKAEIIKGEGMLKLAEEFPDYEVPGSADQKKFRETVQLLDDIGWEKSDQYRNVFHNRRNAYRNKKLDIDAKYSDFFDLNKNQARLKFFTSPTMWKDAMLSAYYENQMKRVGNLMNSPKEIALRTQPWVERYPELKNYEFPKPNHPYLPFGHYLHVGPPGTKILDPVFTKKITPEIWNNQSRNHYNQLSEKVTRKENGGWLNKYK